MLNRDDGRVWAEIERGWAQDHARSPLAARLRRSTHIHTVTSLALAVAFALLGLPVPALFFLFLVPVGLVLHMAANHPPRATG